MEQLAGQAVTVLGAGVAGLAAAIALAQRGAKVTVLEQADAIREFGAGLQITPNGAAVLRAMGLGADLERVALRSQAVELLDGETGVRVLRMDMSQRAPDLGWYLIHRADLIALLADRARAAGVVIHTGQRVERVDLSGAAPRLEMADGSTRPAPILIGADGLHSPSRAALNGRVAPFFTRQVAWRAVIPGTPADPPVAEVHMGPGRHLVSYPLRGGTLRNIVAVEERVRWAEEGWNTEDDPMALRVAFQGFGPRVQDWLAQVERVWLWGLFRHPVAELWGRGFEGGGMLAILGDAAHPTLPFMAQGANMALEDAWVLSAMLGRFGTGAAAVSAFTAARRPRCVRVVAAANANARNYHLSGPLKAVAHLGLRGINALAPAMMLNRFAWVHDHDVTAS